MFLCIPYAKGDRVIHTSMVKYVHQSYAQNQLSGKQKGFEGCAIMYCDGVA